MKQLKSSLNRIAFAAGLLTTTSWLIAACGTGNSNIVPQTPVGGTAGAYGCAYGMSYSPGAYGNPYGGYGCAAGYYLNGGMCVCSTGYNNGYGYGGGYGYGYGYGNCPTGTVYMNGTCQNPCPAGTVYYPSYGCR
jgi:hypothetical protein